MRWPRVGWRPWVAGASGVLLAWGVASFTPIPPAVEWGWPIAAVLAVPVLLLPAQPWLTGVNRLPVARRRPGRRTLRSLLSEAPLIFRIAGLLLMVLALARPRVAHKEVVVESQGLDILVAIDTSGSMRQEDMPTGRGLASRLETAKAVAGQFIRGRPYDRVGVVVFGEEAFTHVPLTLDHDTLISVLDTVDIGIAGSRGTAVGTAIAVCAKRMKALEAPERIVVLLTDGRSNAGRLAPEEAAQAAKALGIRVYTIGVGGGGGALADWMGDGIDEPMMKEVAAITGAQYFRASSMRGLQAVYSRIDELEKSPAKVKEFVDYEELYDRFLVPGMVLLGLSTVLGATWLRRAP
jgi:Ca-activated chloride channel family protein